MQYQGGKSRISRYITEVIVNEVSRWEITHSQTNSSCDFRERESNALVSLFCGACSVETKLAPYFEKVICNDNHEYLIALLDGVKNGYQLPDDISEEEYNYVKNHKDDDKILAGFVGFGSSFGGKWFGGYGRSKKYTLKRRSHAKESKNALMRDSQHWGNVEFICKDYKDVIIPDNAIIYADPPYNNTTNYRNIKFDSDEFWDYAREVSKNHLMFISELEAPDDFVSIWERPVTRTLDRNKNNQFKSVEKLFVHILHTT
mgnify:CR=1 FL=1